MKRSENILIINRDREYREYLEDRLQREGFKVYTAKRTPEAFKKMENNGIDLIISDYYLDDMRGEKFHEEVSTLFPDIPIIFISERADEEAIANILDKPCADYMVQPIVLEELLGRITSFLRTESETHNLGILKVGDLTLNSKTHEVYRGKKSLDLSPTEFKLLKYMMQNKGVVLSREMLLLKVWGYSKDISSRIADVYIGYLRKKVDGGSKKKLIETVTGFGYRIKDS